MLVFNIYCGEKARACCFIVEDCEEIPLPRLAGLLSQGVLKLVPPRATVASRSQALVTCRGTFF